MFGFLFGYHSLVLQNFEVTKAANIAARAQLEQYMMEQQRVPPWHGPKKASSRAHERPHRVIPNKCPSCGSTDFTLRSDHTQCDYCRRKFR